MMSRDIELTAFPFDAEKFREHIVVSLIDPDDIVIKQRLQEKLHLEYLAKYLDSIGAKTFIAESTYFDRDMSRDFWAFNADAASGNECACARVHFFKKKMPDLAEPPKLSLKELGYFIGKHNKKKKPGYLNTESDYLNTDPGYLGFIVILLKSEKIIGTTCLVPPHKDSIKIPTTDSIKIPTTREYEINLVGHTLSVASLGFREQDTVTSACATCALWTVLQKTSEKFNHRALSPGEITARALNLQHRGDALPMANGLTMNDIVLAIRSIPEIGSVTCNFKPTTDNSKLSTQLHPNMSAVLEFILPFIDHGVPVILIMQTPMRTPSKAEENWCVHAVSVVGYTENVSSYKPIKARRISNLIIHDDNIGPFVLYRKEAGGLVSADYCYVGPKKKEEWQVVAAIGICHGSIKVFSCFSFYAIQSAYSELLDLILCSDKDNIGSIQSHRGEESVGIIGMKIQTSNEYKERIMRNKETYSNEHSNEQKMQNILSNFLLKNLPDYILVMSFNYPVHHDLVFSMAGPWDFEFLDFIPHNPDTIDFFSSATKQWRTIELESFPKIRNNPYIRQIVHKILGLFSS